MATFVLVHGAWDGAWAWRPIARELQRASHEVFTPTLTGSGERVHLASPEIDLTTHTLDVSNLLRYEKLEDVILVGYSYGGMVVTAVAEQMPECLNQIIYLDAFVPEDGQSLADFFSPEINAEFANIALTYGDGWRVPHDPPDADRRTDALMKPLSQGVSVGNPLTAQLRHTYVHYTGKTEDSFVKPYFERIAARVRDEGWNYRELPFDHFPQLVHPREVADLLLSLI
jgi:pimeloyl-ACP methyl ester carboxylesterase